MCKKQNFGNFLLGPCISMIPFCIPDPHSNDMFWDLVGVVLNSQVILSRGVLFEAR